MRKARKWSRLIILILVFVCAMGMFSKKAYAWKTKTHGFSANLLLKEAEDGKVTVDGKDYAIPEEYLEALKQYPNAFRAGTLGPDFYPDMLTGQSYIHPYDAAAGVGVGDWLMELVKGVNSLPKNSNARKEALAFTLGMAIHFAGDQFGHDFINAFAGGAYPSYAEAAQSETKRYYIIRHMAEESYMDTLIGERLGDTGVNAPEVFITNTWIYEGTANAGPAKIYSKYSGGMMYQYKYLVELRQKLYNYAEKNRYSIWPPLPQIVQYLDKWIEDLDTATYELVVAFDYIAHDFMTGVDGKSEIQIVTSRLNEWMEDYGTYASPAPDVLSDIAKAFKKSQEWVLKELGLEKINEKWKEFQNRLISDMLVWGLTQAGIDVKFYEQIVKDPKMALEENGGSTADYEEYMTYMNAFAQDAESLDAFYNTLLMGKLILMGPENLHNFFASYSVASSFSDTTGQIMMDEIRLWIKTSSGSGNGTDDNVICDVYEGNTRITSKLLDISGYDDFEAGEDAAYYIELPKKISPADLRVALRVEKNSELDLIHPSWRANDAWIECYCLGSKVLGGKKVLPHSVYFDTFGERKWLSFSVDADELKYTTALNPTIISYMKSNDNSTQWVNERNILWNNFGARTRVLYEVFHGFKPTIELSADQTVFTPGTKATLTANFTSYWNGITKERRDREEIIKDVGEMKQQACNGTVRIMDVSGATPKQVLTGTVKNGVMTVDLSSLAAGKYKLRADFDGDDYNGSGQSNVVEITVASTSYNVTFQVVNGTWDNGSREDIKIKLIGTGTELYLSADQIPAVGNHPVDNSYKAGSWEPMLDTETPITKDTTFVYTYAKKKAISQTVTFEVVNGSWDDGSTDKKTVVLRGYEGDTLKLSGDQIPAVGNAPADHSYKAGGWDPVPDTETAISGNPTYTYTYAKKAEISQTVTFEVVNGSWDDGSTDKKTVVLSGYEGDKLKLSEDQIPAVGNAPADHSYKAGSWDTVPDTEKEISGNPTFTYTYAKKEAISATVTFEVVNGFWDDGTDEKKTIVLNGYEGDVLKLSAEQIPAVGSKPVDNTYKPGSWDKTPDTETAISGDPTYTYTYALKEKYTVSFETDGGTPVPDAVVLAGDTAAKPADPEKTSFVFAGWFADEDLETPYDFSAEVLSDLVLYAAWEPVTYSTEGEIRHTSGSAEDAVITVHRSHFDETCFAHFTGVMIDGQPLEEGTDYTAAAGSTVITLKAAMLEKLPVGEHAVTVSFDDGQAETGLIVNSVLHTPDSGDSSDPVLWTVLLIASLSGIAAFTAYDRKRGAAVK